MPDSGVLIFSIFATNWFWDIWVFVAFFSELPSFSLFTFWMKNYFYMKGKMEMMICGYQKQDISRISSQKNKSIYKDRTEKNSAGLKWPAKCIWVISDPCCASKGWNIFLQIKLIMASPSHLRVAVNSKHQRHGGFSVAPQSRNIHVEADWRRQLVYPAAEQQSRLWHQ